MKIINIIQAAVILGAMLLLPGISQASVIWEISDGNPNYYMSDAIVVRHTGEMFFDAREPNPAGLVWQDPIAGQTNYVWVRVARFGPFIDGDDQTGRLRLFIGHAGYLFQTADYDYYNPIFNTNLLEPPETPFWKAEEWDTNLVNKAVVPVRWKPLPLPTSWSYEYALDDDSTLTPQPGGYRWLRFELEPYRLPSTNSTDKLPFSLVAYIFDPDSYQGGDVTTNLAMAERRFNVLGIDYGDAPDPIYQALLANDGARHLATGPMLGDLRDGELDGLPSNGADGDDKDGFDDEDGVVFENDPLPDTTVSINVTAPSGGILNAWADFNLDGDWLDAGEQIFTDEVLAVGINELDFNVPITANTSSPLYARFRINSTGGLGPAGLAVDGEVEDYVVEKSTGFSWPIFLPAILKKTENSYK